MGCTASQPAATVAPSASPQEVSPAPELGKPSSGDPGSSQLREKVLALKASLIQQKEVLAAQEEAYTKASEEYDAMQTLKCNAEEQLLADAKGGNRIARERLTKAREECSEWWPWIKHRQKYLLTSTSRTNPNAGVAEETHSSLKASVEAMRTLYHTAQAQVRDAEGSLARATMAGLSLSTSALEETKKLELRALVRALETTEAQAEHNKVLDTVAGNVGAAAQSAEAERLARIKAKKAREDAEWN